ncbi:MAG: L-threonine 3-dehydrogenase [Planctomycetes bacterium RBG_16_59_8]|nr:MAG: L-threonine 3-dehydrogenase [Planctomycetes bacterium RBG_16_59_8]
MKAVMKENAGAGLVLREVKEPSPAAGEVLLKVRAASICGTDVHIYNWDRWAESAVKPPRILGHEFTAEVADLGKGVVGWKKGDLVSVESHIPCLECYQCKNGFMHICDRLKIIGIDTDGGFADYVAVPQVCLWKIDSRLPLETATVLEPLGNAVHAVSAVDVAGKSAVVFGCGPTGLFVTRVLKAVGAGKIACVDINAMRLELARSCGATELFPGDATDLPDRLRAWSGGYGADVVFEMSGSKAGLTNGLSSLKKGGTLIAFGLSRQPIEVDVSNQVIMTGRKIVGIVGRLMFDTWKKMAAMIEEGRLDPRPVVTHKFRMDQIDEAMKTISQPNAKVGKVMLVP